VKLLQRRPNAQSNETIEWVNFSHRFACTLCSEIWTAWKFPPHFEMLGNVIISGRCSKVIFNIFNTFSWMRIRLWRNFVWAHESYFPTKNCRRKSSPI
jgi:hypothetical protein